MEKNKNEKKEKRIRISTLFFSLLIVAVAFVVVIGALIYGAGVDNQIVKTTAKYIPYPAVLVGYNNWITINELEERLKASQHFYENQNFSSVGLRVDFSTEEGKKRLKIRERELLNKMVENKIIEILLSDNEAEITAGVVDQEVSRKVSDVGSWNSTNEKLAKLYGWTLDEFKKEIVKPDLHQEKLKEIFESKYSANESKEKKIKEAERALEEKEEFAGVAKKYSEGSTAQDGGNMGWIKEEQLMSGLVDVVLGLEVGKVSRIAETELGYHIIKLDERKVEEKEEVFRISQIFVRKNDFANWLEEQIKKFKIIALLKNYTWNKEDLNIQFSNAELREFEKKAYDEFQGDASIMK